MEHKGRQHAWTNEWKIKPKTVLGKISHEVAKIPKHIGDANEEKDAIEKGPGSSDQDEDNKNEVN